MLDALSSSWLAQTVTQSQMLTAGLSAVHLLGFALVMATGIAVNLRLLGVVLVDRPVAEFTRPASRTLMLGVAVSAVTGALLFLPRASGAVANEFFRAKMLLLLAVLAFHVVVARRMAGRGTDGQTFRLFGALGLLLWLSLALAASAFILIE